MNKPSPTPLPGSQRIHIALAVTDLIRSQAFYTTLLGEAPTKVRPGYTKFEPVDPSVNLTLNEVPQRVAEVKPATHYGIQVKTVEAVQEAIDRLSNAGLPTRVQENTACCYAVQDKVWATDPDGNEWEVFVVLEADSPHRSDTDAPCCESGPEPTCSVTGSADGSASACCEPQG